jgi:hypothetical protein
VECSSRHLSGRSLQVFRALRLPLSSHGAACMLYCLHMVLTKAATNAEDVTALQCAMEIILSLQVAAPLCFTNNLSLTQRCPPWVRVVLIRVPRAQSLVDSTPAPKLILYPQLFWACMSLLPMPYPQLYHEVCHSVLFTLSLSAFDDRSFCVK